MRVATMLAALALVSIGAARPARAAHLTYHGGRLLTAPRFINVFWGSYWSGAGASDAAYLNSFLADIAPSPSYTSALAEYAVAGYPIQPASSEGGFFIGSEPGASMDDLGIRKFLDGAILAGQVPARADDRVYMVLLPPGTSFQFGPGLGTAGGYHTVNQVSATGGLVHYIVVPDATGQTGIISHEMIETITDPDALDLSRGWYDDAAGVQGPFTAEIGDLCEGAGDAVVDGYAVAQAWSNVQGGCVTAGLASPPSGCPAGTHDQGGICVPDQPPTGCRSGGALPSAILILLLLLPGYRRMLRAA